MESYDLSSLEVRILAHYLRENEMSNRIQGKVLASSYQIHITHAPELSYNDLYTSMFHTAFERPQHLMELQLSIDLTSIKMVRGDEVKRFVEGIKADIDETLGNRPSMNANSIRGLQMRIESLERENSQLIARNSTLVNEREAASADAAKLQTVVDNNFVVNRELFSASTQGKEIEAKRA